MDPIHSTRDGRTGAPADHLEINLAFRAVAHNVKKWHCIFRNIYILLLTAFAHKVKKWHCIFRYTYITSHSSRSRGRLRPKRCFVAFWAMTLIYQIHDQALCLNICISFHLTGHLNGHVIVHHNTIIAHMMVTNISGQQFAWFCHKINSQYNSILLLST